MDFEEIDLKRIHSYSMAASILSDYKPFGCDNSGNITFTTHSDTNPTQEEINAKADELYALMPLQDLREKRNQLLAETDWTQIGDVVLANKEEWKTYRQALRDLPSVSVDAAYDVAGNLINVEYPTKPGQ